MGGYNIPAPPSGSIVDTNPLASQSGSIPPPPSGSIVDADPSQNSGLSPDLLNNSKGEGTYQMTTPKGVTVNVPYSKVDVLTGLTGYNFASPDEQQRYTKDAQADPLSTQSSDWTKYKAGLTNPVGSGAREQGLVGGALQVGGQAINTMAQPIAHPVNTVEGGLKMGAYLMGKAMGVEMPEEWNPMTSVVQNYMANKEQGGNALALENLGGQILGTVEGGRALGGAVSKVAPAVIPDSITAKLNGTAPEPVADATTDDVNTPGILKQAWSGKKSVQPATQASVQNAIGTSADEAGVEAPASQDLRGMTDDLVQNLKQAKSQAYQQNDQIAGQAIGQDKLDLQALKEQVDTDTYNLQQLRNSDPDKAGRLIEAINENRDTIQKAESALQDAGIDPKQADVLNTKWQRSQQFQQTLTKATNPDGSVDVDKLYEGIRNMRALKVNGRVVDGAEQLFGTDGANTLENRLYQMKNIGAQAVKAQWVKRILMYEVGKHLFGNVGGKTAKVATEMLP